MAIMDLPHDSIPKLRRRMSNSDGGILPRNTNTLLDKNGDNWNRRTDLKNYTGDAMPFSKLKEAWIRQEIRYNSWKRRREVSTVERSPTPFPLDVYRQRREESRGPWEARPRITIKREETTLASREATEAPTTPKPAVGTNRLRATSSSETEARVRASSRITDTQNIVEEGSSGQEDRPVSQRTFSEERFIERMIENMGLEEMRKKKDDKFGEEMAKILAKYDIYRAECCHTDLLRWFDVAASRG